MHVSHFIAPIHYRSPARPCHDTAVAPMRSSHHTRLERVRGDRCPVAEVHTGVNDPFTGRPGQSAAPSPLLSVRVVRAARAARAADGGRLRARLRAAPPRRSVRPAGRHRHTSRKVGQPGRRGGRGAAPRFGPRTESGRRGNGARPSGDGSPPPTAVAPTGSCFTGLSLPFR